MIYWLSSAGDSAWAKSPLASRLGCVWMCECDGEVTARGLNSDLSVTVNAHPTDSSHLLRPKDWNCALSTQRKINTPLRGQEKVKDDQLVTCCAFCQQQQVPGKCMKLCFYINFICTTADFSAHINDFVFPQFYSHMCLLYIEIRMCVFMFSLLFLCIISLSIWSVPVLFLLYSSDRISQKGNCILFYSIVSCLNDK